MKTKKRRATRAKKARTSATAKTKRKAMRTKKGGVSAAARKKYGTTSRAKGRTGSFPVFDKKSARSALKLRGHGSTPRSAVISKVSRFASKTNDAGLKAAVKKARKADKGR